MYHQISVGREKGYEAWVNEGLAVWSEYAVGLEGDRPEEMYVWRARRLGLARSTAQAGTLIPLSSLERGKDWTSRPADRKPLQYAQAYTVIRFMVDKFGLPLVINFARSMREYATVGEALEASLSVTYEQLEADAVSWAKSVDVTESLRGLDQAIATDPSKWAYYRRAQTYCGLSQYRDALVDFDRAIRLDAGSAEAYRMRAIVHSRLRNDAQKRADRYKACSLD